MSPDTLNMHRRWLAAPADGRSGPEGAGPAIVGYIDRIDGARVSGWAWDRTQPDLALDVEIRLGGRSVATVRADRLRKDLARSGTGNGYHAFEAVLDAPIAEADRALVAALARAEGQPDAVPLVNRAGDPPTAASTAAPPPELRRWLDDLGAIQRAFEQTLKVAAQEIREAVRGRGTAVSAEPSDVSGAIEELRSRQEELAKQLSALEVFHTRFDGALRALERPKIEAAPEDDSNRGLRMAVIAIAVLSSLSLLVGLFSVLT
jgi:hypothetical protein